MKKILVVDDEEDVRYTLKYGLEGLSKDYRVVDVENGKKCLEALEKEGMFDLIILDIMMPEMNGWEVHRRLKDRADWRTIPLVFLTAVGDPTSKQIIRLSGATFVGKPVDIQELQQKIKKLLR